MAQERALVIAAFGPLILAVLIRLGAPWAAELASPSITLETYYPVIAGSMAVFAPILYGFVIGMFLFEDREQGVLVAFRTSPLADRGYILYRVTTAYVVSVVATFPAVALIGLVDAPIPVIVGTVLVGGFTGAVLALAFGSLASDTIEGIALSKLLNLFVLGPAFIIAFVPEPVQFLAGIIPMYWPVKTYVAGVSGEPLWVLYVTCGVFVHIGALTLFGWVFSKRMD